MFFPVLGYAESHYKFRLPWSPLHEPWPEILLDAPSLVEPGKKWPVWLVVKDANVYPTRINKIDINVSGGHEATRTFSLDLALTCEDAFHFIPLDIPLASRRGLVTVSAKIYAERQGTVRKFQEWSYPGLSPLPLQVQVLQHPFPKASGWWAGETHCHTWHSSDPVEFGSPASILQESAKALGLDFVLTTDHSYDFCFRKDDFLKPVDPNLRWDELKREVADLSSYPLIVPGEEVSCGNANGENVHLIVPNPKSYIPGLGDSGRQWFRNHPTLSIQEVLQRAEATPCFAAHPQSAMDWLERKVFRRGPYQTPDMHYGSHNPIAGLEFWNGEMDAGFEAGRQFWIAQLMQGHHILPIAGNDAHGDLNRFTGVHIPLFKLRASRNRLFGRVRSVFKAPEEQQAPTQEMLFRSIRSAQESGSMYCTNGPSLEIQLENHQYDIICRSSTDFGELKEAKIFWATKGDKGEFVRKIPLQKYECRIRDSMPSNCIYIRVECETVTEHYALSAACWNNAG